eukprot:TRINITY_DN4231_c0_g1_i4.p1 TRINITY_DN4231_c0_g1~~TRINITY_DN4231_c0_g1_i4.p1  ORF type:complete len:533 (+),score=130.41 TRINITY_DN4231_c0_g1_i4:59-1657(+)
MKVCMGGSSASLWLTVVLLTSFCILQCYANDSTSAPSETSSSPQENAGQTVQKQHEYAGINSLLFVGILCCCLFLGRLIHYYRFYYLPQSCASMLLGFVIGMFLTFFGQEEVSYISFDPSVFFFVILPAIIFDAGHSLKKRDFFRNFSTIMLFAIFGTVVSTLVIGFALFGMARIGIVPLNATNPSECLMFGALISSVDPVATLSILGDENIRADPLLYSLVFGESVLNDAVAIVLFKTFEQYSHLPSLDGVTPWSYIGNFLSVSLGSTAIGVIIALLCSFLFRRSDFSETPPYEFTLTFLFAYASYCLSEIIGMSGIVALFFCGIVISHYNYYNLSKISQGAMKYIVHSFSLVAETFLYAYLGLTAAVSLEPQVGLKWSPTLIIASILLCVVSRALNIFPFANIANLGRRQKISLDMQIVMWFAGLRGAVSFALSLSVSTDSRPVIVTTTLTVVVVTTFVLGGLTEKLLTYLGLSGAAAGNDPQRFQPLVSPASRSESPGGIHRFWKDFDNYVSSVLFSAFCPSRLRSFST